MKAYIIKSGKLYWDSVDSSWAKKHYYATLFPTKKAAEIETGLYEEDFMEGNYRIVLVEIKEK